MKIRSLALLFLSACGGGGGTNEPGSVPGGAEVPAGSGPVSLSYSPLAPNELSRIVPLGNLNPPGHTLPTDHLYFYSWYYDDGPVPDPQKKHTVYAPASGTVEWIFQPSNDYKVSIRCTNTFSYYLDHILPSPGIVVGAKVQAGQVLGTSSGPYAIDLGVVDETQTLAGFANPARYPFQTLHAASPLAYYDEPLRSALLTRVMRIGSDKHGKIDFDVPGTLSGGWFLEGLPVQESQQPAGWDKHLAFVPDVYDPSILRVSIGGQLAKVGAFAAEQFPLDPKLVTPASGKVAYRLYNRGGLMEQPFYGNQLGLVLVQMLAADQIQVEAFDGALGNADFTADAKIYTR